VSTTTSESLPMLLRALKLPAFLTYHAEVAERAEREGWSFVQYLQHLVVLEVDERRGRRIQRQRAIHFAQVASGAFSVAGGSWGGPPTICR